VIINAIIIYAVCLYLLEAFGEEKMEMMRDTFKNELSVKVLQRIRRDRNEP